MALTWQTPLLFLFGGAGYVFIELLWRRRSHISMFIAGGTCFLFLAWLSGLGLPFLLKCIIAGIAITVVEFIIGCVVNLWLKLDVWDYSELRFNVLGQVSLLFTVLWCGLGGLALVAVQFFV